MKNFSIIILYSLILLGSTLAHGQARPFITSWSVTAGDEITIPVNTDLAYDFSYVWKDDSGAEIAPVTQATGDIVQQFSLTGTVTLEITGAFPHFQGYPKSQLLDVQQWGDIVWESFEGSFQNWTGTGFSAVDKPDLSQGPTMLLMFRSATNFNENLNTWEVGNVTNMQAAFRGASSFNGDISNWDVSKVTNMLRAFEGASQFDQDLSNWNISQVFDMSFAFDRTNLSTANYNNILIAWSQQDVQEGVNLGASGLSFCEGKAGRNVLTNDKNWTIIGDERFCPTDIRDFTITGQVGSTVLDTTNFEIVVRLPEGTNRSSLTPSFTLFEGSTSIPTSGEVQSFVNPATYTVTAADGTSQAWTVRVDDFKPFITSWSVTDGDEITIPVNTNLTYDFSYVWKDDSGAEIAPVTQATGDIVQQFSLTGTVTLEITGTFPHFQGYPKDQLLDVLQWGDIVWGSMGESFRDWKGTGFSALDAPNLANVTSMQGTFRDASSFNGNVGSWQVGSVDNMNRMFNNADAFNQDLNEWDVSNVTNMHDMFFDADIFNGDISQWNTESVDNMQGMFADANAFSADLSQWDVGEVTSMRAMFSNAQNFQSDLSAWDVSNVTQMNLLFRGADLFNSDLSDWDVGNVTNMERMFFSAQTFNADLSNWDVSKVTNMSAMLDNSGLSPENYDALLMAWSQLDVQQDVSLGASGLFFCQGKQAKDALINSKSWTISGDEMFCPTDIRDFTITGQVGSTVLDTTNFEIVVTLPEGTNRSSLTPSFTLFEGSTSIPASGEVQSFVNPATYTVTAADGAMQAWTVRVDDFKSFITSWSVTDGDEITIPVNTNLTYDFSYVWKDDTGTEIAPVTQATGDIVQQFSLTGTVTLEISGVFPHFQGYPKDQLLDVLQWGDIVWGSFVESFQDWSRADFSATDTPNLSQVTNMARMFQNAAAFNGDLSDWDVSNVTNMSSLFLDASSFNASISGWDVSNVNTMQSMFDNADAFNQDLDEWNVGNVTNMSFMFSRNGSFNGNIGTWNVENVTDMQSMFDNAEAFNQDLDKWNTGNVTNMSFMFARNKSFNGNIGTWNVARVTTMFRMFQNAGAFNQDLTNWNPTSLETMFRMFDNANSFNGDISTWNVESVTNMGQAFKNADAFNQDLSDWDVSSVTTMSVIFNGTSLTPQNYDKILIGWAALPGLQEGVSLGAEGITFCKGAAARAVLTNEFGWDITDSDESCSDETDILSFVLTDQTGDAVINSDEYTISIEVLFTNVLDTLAPSITLSPGATSDPVSGEQIDFASPVSFTVTAEDGTTTQNWVVTVTVAPNTATNITGFELPTQTGDAVINRTDHTVAIEVEFGTEVSSLIPTFTLSEGATSNPISGEEADFSDPVVYTIIAQDGTTTQDWTVSVTVAPNTETDILTFILSEQTGDAVINRTDHTVVVEVAFGTELSALVPTFTLSEGATSNPASGVAQDFTNPVTYVVTTQDGTATQDWTVSVTVAPNTETDILTFALAEQTGAALINIANHTVAIEVAADTDASVLVPTFTLSQGASSNPASDVAQDFTNPVTYVVTAEDGKATQDWTVVVTVADSPLGLDDEIGLRIYPNPVSHVLQVKTKEEVSISLTDLNGRVIIGEKQGSLFQMSLSNLKNGIYLLVIRSGNEITSRRIIKNN